MNVVGLDLSLTATGVAHDRGKGIITTRARGMERLARIRDDVITCCLGADLVVIEDYAFSRGESHSHALGELGGVVRLALWEAAVTYVDVKATNLKKFATDKGNAPKDAVLVAAVRAGYEGDDNNEADAWWLRQMGLYHLGVPEVPITVYRTTAVNVVAWPELVKS